MQPISLVVFFFFRVETERGERGASQDPPGKRSVTNYMLRLLTLMLVNTSQRLIFCYIVALNVMNSMYITYYYVYLYFREQQVPRGYRELPDPRGHQGHR